MSVNEQYSNYLETGEGWRLLYLSEEQKKSWHDDFVLLECRTCYDDSCPWRNRKERLPVNAGGKLQCLRYVSDRERFAFRNGDGSVIAIPGALIDRIVDTVIGEVEDC